MSLMSVPNDGLTLIASYLPIIDQKSAACTSKKFKRQLQIYA